METLPLHSPLGGSSAYRWLPPPYGGGCEASPSLARGFVDPESDYAAEGTAAHALAAHCLAKGSDAWHMIGTHIFQGDFVSPPGAGGPDTILVTKDMADAVQVYLDAVRRLRMSNLEGPFDVEWIEHRFHSDRLHPLMYGQVDYALRRGDTLHVWDYKHGAGIVVEVQNNPQLMYYAVGLLTALGLWGVVSRVVLHIAQPRGWHSEGPIRSWETSAKDLSAWAHDVLRPAMERVSAGSDITRSGEHCRFCPARYLACPQLLKDAKELEALMKKAKEKGGAPHLTNDEIGRLLTLGEGFKIMAKAARETGFARAEKGAVIPGWKLAKARSNREWKDGAEAAAREKFGNDAFTKPALLSPAGIDALPEGTTFTTKHAFKPDAGLQLVPEADARREAGPSVKSMFKPVGAKRRQK